jgi:hypothetical protein
VAEDATEINPEGCGRSVESTLRVRRLVNGTISNQQSWGWQAIIEDDEGSVCSGALINSQWILTNALFIT